MFFECLNKDLELTKYTDQANRSEIFNIQSHLARDLQAVIKDRLIETVKEEPEKLSFPAFSAKTEAEQVEEIKRELCSDQNYQNIRFGTISHNFNFNHQLKNDDLQSVV